MTDLVRVDQVCMSVWPILEREPELLFSPTIRGAISLTIRSPFAVKGMSLTPV